MASNANTTTATTTVYIPRLQFNEKTDNKRHSKPLPIKPLPLPPNISTIDDSSRIHVSKLLSNWLADLNIPAKQWSDVLFNIVLTLYEKAMIASSTQSSNNNTNNKSIWIQTFTNNSPVESKFLLDVFHGKALSNGKSNNNLL
jgi:hypothetical protein